MKNQEPSAFLLGFDVGFSSIGIARLGIVAQGLTFVDAEVVQTKKSGKKREVRAADDNMRRVAEIAMKLDRWVKDDIVAICCESQSWPIQKQVCIKIAFTWGVIGTLACLRGIPILQSSPQEVKDLLVGNKSASKDDIIKAIRKKFPTVPWPKAKGLHEHMADAIASGLACQNHAVIQAVRKMRSR